MMEMIVAHSILQPGDEATWYVPCAVAMVLSGLSLSHRVLTYGAFNPQQVYQI